MSATKNSQDRFKVICWRVRLRFRETATWLLLPLLRITGATSCRRYRLAVHWFSDWRERRDKSIIVFVVPVTEFDGCGIALPTDCVAVPHSIDHANLWRDTTDVQGRSQKFTSGAAGQTVYSPWWCLGPLSLPSIRGQLMRTSVGWEGKGGYGSFHSWINAWVCRLAVKFLDNACHTSALPQWGFLTKRCYVMCMTFKFYLYLIL